MAESRILVAVSSAWAGERIFQPLKGLSTRLEASVILVHVLDPQTAGDQDNQAGQSIALIADRLKLANIKAETLLLLGNDPARAILNAADEQKATLILLGLSGKGTVSKLIAGDVPIQVAKSAKVPVLLVPYDWAGVL